MSSRYGTLALLLLLPMALAAQAPARPLAVTTPPHVTAAPGGSAEAPICDGSELRGAKKRAKIGVALMGAGLPVALVGMYMTVHSRNHPDGPVATGVGAGAGLAILGFSLAAASAPGESFWNRAIGRMKTGETRTADVRSCLSTPIAKVSTDTLEEWTYLTSRTGTKSVRLTFRDSVLVGIRRAEVAPSLQQASPITLPADPTQPPR